MREAWLKVVKVRSVFDANHLVAVLLLRAGLAPMTHGRQRCTRIHFNCIIDDILTALSLHTRLRQVPV
jgi:hypothetical protein